MRKFFDYLKTRQFYTNTAIAIASFVAVILIAFYSLSFYTRHGSGIAVPLLDGMNIDKATSLLDQQGFHYQIDSVYISDKPGGTVILQDPDAGINVKENRTIYLTIVKSQAPDVLMPDIEQKPLREVLSTISNFGLKLGDTTYKPDIARDLVLEVKFAGQPIKPGSKIPKGSRIDLVLGNGAGASEVDIPEVVNLDLDAARFVIKNSGLVIGTISSDGAITDSGKAIIKTQFPMKTDSASKVSIGTRVNLTITQQK